MTKAGDTVKVVVCNLHFCYMYLLQDITFVTRTLSISDLASSGPSHQSPR